MQCDEKKSNNQAEWYRNIGILWGLMTSWLRDLKLAAVHGFVLPRMQFSFCMTGLWPARGEGIHWCRHWRSVHSGHCRRWLPGIPRHRSVHYTRSRQLYLLSRAVLLIACCMKAETGRQHGKTLPYILVYKPPPIPTSDNLAKTSDLRISR